RVRDVRSRCHGRLGPRPARRRVGSPREPRRARAPRAGARADQRLARARGRRAVIDLDGGALSLEAVEAVARRGEEVRLSPAASRARGASGVRPAVVETVIACLNRRVHPIVPELGSVGASGDLAPLAHVALCLVGEGAASDGDGQIPAAQALARAGVRPLVLETKEGLALLNGTHLMAALGALAILDAGRLTRLADVTGAMSL